MSGPGPLRHVPFRWLVAGRVVDALGNAVAPIALAFALLDLTGSVSALGLVVGAQSLARVLLLLFGGVLADRLPRRLVLTGSNVVAALTQALLAVAVLAGVEDLRILTLLAVVTGATGAFSLPAAAALLPETVPPGELRPANALAGIGLSGAAVGGAAVAGLLVAVVGPGWGLAVDAVSFLLAAGCYAGVRTSSAARQAGEPTSTWQELRDGWSEFVARRWTWVVVLAFLGINTAWVGGATVLGPAVADQTVGRRAWGLVLAANGAGLLLGGILALRWQPSRPLLVGMLATLGLSLPLFGLALVPLFAVLVGAGLVAGVGVQLFEVSWQTALQEQVPTARLARVQSYDAVGSFVAIPLGQVAVGPLAEAAGLRPVLLGCAVVILLATVLAVADPSVRGLRASTTS